MNEGTSDHNACFSKVRNSFRWQPELANFCTEKLVTKKDEILNFVDPNVINSQHDMDMCVEKIEHFLNEEIGVFFKVKGGQHSQAPTSKPCKKNTLFLSDDDKPWFDHNLKQLYRDYVSALCKINNCKSTENHDN